MKKIFLFTISLSFITLLSFGQTRDSTSLSYYNRDTLRYFNTVFYDNANLYINQPIKKLVDKIQLPNKEYFFNPTGKRIDSVFDVSITFMDEQTINKSLLSQYTFPSYTLEITLLNPISRDRIKQINTLDRISRRVQKKSIIDSLIIKDFKFYKLPDN